jgi:HSP20 family protein
MAILTRDPLLANPLGVADELFRSVLGTSSQTIGFVPTLDVRELENEHLVVVDLPGVNAADVSIEVEDRLLTISGIRVPFEIGQAQLVERPYGAFSRTLTIPQGVDADSIRADYANGVLMLHVPKPASAQRKRIAINGTGEDTIENSDD